VLVSPINRVNVAEPLATAGTSRRQPNSADVRRVELDRRRATVGRVAVDDCERTEAAARRHRLVDAGARVAVVLGAAGALVALGFVATVAAGQNVGSSSAIFTRWCPALTRRTSSLR